MDKKIYLEINYISGHLKKWDNIRKMSLLYQLTAPRSNLLNTVFVIMFQSSKERNKEKGNKHNNNM